MTSLDEGKTALLTRLAQIGGALAGAFGIVALFGWLAGLPLLATLGSGKIPMAPSTALLFMVFGATIFLHAGMRQSRGVRRMGVACGVSGAVLSLMLLFLSSFDVYMDAEHLGIRITGTLNGAPIGH